MESPSNTVDVEAAKEGQQVQQRAGSTSCWWYACKYFFGILFAIFFVYATVVQFNDTDGVAGWAIFYLFHGFLSLMGLVNPPTFRPSMLPAAAFMLVWSLVLVIISSSKLTWAEPGGPDEGGDMNNKNSREEIGYELGGALIGVFSGIFHAVLFKFSPPPTLTPNLS